MMSSSSSNLRLAGVNANVNVSAKANSRNTEETKGNKPDSSSGLFRRPGNLE
jgi:hypothetical protein